MQRATHTYPSTYNGTYVPYHAYTEGCETAFIGRDEATESNSTTNKLAMSRHSRKSKWDTPCTRGAPSSSRPHVSLISKENIATRSKTRACYVIYPRHIVVLNTPHLRSPRASLLAPRAPAPAKKLEDIEVAPQSSLPASPAIPRTPPTPYKLDDVHVAPESGGGTGRFVPRAFHAVGPPQQVHVAPHRSARTHLVFFIHGAHRSAGAPQRGDNNEAIQQHHAWVIIVRAAHVVRELLLLRGHCFALKENAD